MMNCYSNSPVHLCTTTWLGSTKLTMTSSGSGTDTTVSRVRHRCAFRVASVIVWRDFKSGTLHSSLEQVRSQGHSVIIINHLYCIVKFWRIRIIPFILWLQTLKRFCTKITLFVFVSTWGQESHKYVTWLNPISCDPCYRNNYQDR